MAFDIASPFRGAKRKADEIGSPEEQLDIIPSEIAVLPDPNQTSGMFDPIGPFMFDDDASGCSSQGCHCRLSKCSKMYCDCFAAGRYCGPACRCNGCENCPTNEGNLAAIRRGIKQRNPNAFESKIRRTAVGSRRHTQGCRCSKSKCLKRYCECYREGMPCSKECQCIDCHNGQQSSSELPVVAPLPTNEDALLDFVASGYL